MHKVLPQSQVLQLDTQANVIQALEAGRVDAAAVDLSTVWWLAKRQPDKYADAGYSWNSHALLRRPSGRAISTGWTSSTRRSTSPCSATRTRSSTRRCADFFGLQPPVRDVRPAASPDALRVQSQRGGGSRRRLNYHFNFTLIWRNFDKIAWGLVLSPRARGQSASPSASSSASRVRSRYTDGPRWLRPRRHGLCRVHPQRPADPPRLSGLLRHAERRRLQLRAGRIPSSRRSRSMPAPTWSRSSAPGSTQCHAVCSMPARRSASRRSSG